MTVKATYHRYGFIDAIRGLAACLVMLQHSLYQSGLLGAWPNTELAGFIPTWLELGETGVVAFFLVSGFVIPLSLEKTKSIRMFWIHRALRIYPLYLLVFAANFLLLAGGHTKTIGMFAVNLVTHLFFIQEYLGQENFVGGSWTLSLELFWYIAISGLFVIGLNKKSGLIVGLSILGSVAAQLSCVIGVHLPMGRLSMLLCCVIGLVCYRREQNEIPAPYFRCLASGLIITIFCNILVGEALYPAVHPTATFQMASVSWALAAVIFFVPFFARANRIWHIPPLGMLGQVSYSVYLLHPIVLFVLSSIQIQGAGLVCSTFIITIALANVTYRVVERPFVRMGHTRRVVMSAAAHPLAAIERQIG